MDDGRTYLEVSVYTGEYSTETQHTHEAISRVGFEPTIPQLEQSRTTVSEIFEVLSDV